MQTTYAQKNETAQRAADNTAAAVHDNSPQSESLQRKASLANAAVQRAENPPRPNNTGLPDDLKNGVESLSGYSLDNVRVHYNSPKPATVQALAYTQGTDIHVAPGQEHTLPHEAWHVTQQMAGRVTPTTNIGGMPVNDNAALEHEADVMGEKAVTQRMGEGSVCSALVNKNISQDAVQCDHVPRVKDFSLPNTSATNTSATDTPATDTPATELPVIAFEVMTNVNRKQEVINLYEQVISKYNGIAHIYIGVNMTTYNGTNDPIDEDSKELQKQEEVPDTLNDAVVDINKEITEWRNKKGRDQLHHIHIIPFIYIPTHNPPPNQNGGYTFPFMEARHLLMTKARECDASIFRWIDSDVRDDTSIDAINRNGKKEFCGCEAKSWKQSVVFSGLYNWRNDAGTVNEKVNKLEEFLRRFFWSCKRDQKTNFIKYEGKGYIPEPIAYMNKAAHEQARENLEKSVKALGYKGNKSCQQNEAKIAFDGMSMIFKPDFSVSKPVKQGYSVSSSIAVDEVRQTAYNWNWDGVDKDYLVKVFNLLSSNSIEVKDEQNFFDRISDDVSKSREDTLNDLNSYIAVKGGDLKINNKKNILTTIGGFPIFSRKFIKSIAEVKEKLGIL